MPKKIVEDKKLLAQFEREAAIEQAKHDKAFAKKKIAMTKFGMSGPYRPKGFDGLVGGKIVGIGFHPDAHEGGMTIDYEKDGKTMRTVFGYTELGIWVYWQGERGY